MKKLTLIFVIFELALYSCGETALDGQSDDVIQLSSTEVSFAASEDSTTLTTQGSSWWLIGVRSDHNAYYTFDDIDVLSANFQLQIDGLTVKRLDGTRLFLKVSANTTGENRQFYVDLQDGNFFQVVSIVQE